MRIKYLEEVDVKAAAVQVDSVQDLDVALEHVVVEDVVLEVVEAQDALMIPAIAAYARIELY